MFIVYCDVCDTTCCCVLLALLRVNLLPMYTVFVALCVAHFPVKE